MDLPLGARLIFAAMTAANLAFHVECLRNSCRICGKHKSQKSKEYYHQCKKMSSELSAVFGADIEKDDLNVHPPKVCNNCYAKCQKGIKNCTAIDDKSVQWFVHEENCDICKIFETKLQGGRKRKCTKGRGRPKGTSTLKKSKSDCFQIPCEVISPSITDDMPGVERFHQPPEDLICPICKEIFHQPVQLSCEHVFCFKCINTWLNHAGSLAKCPTCSEVLSNIFHKVPRLILNVLCSLPVSCKCCKQLVQLGQLKYHESQCREYISQAVSTTLTDVLCSAPNEPLSNIEEHVTTHLMKRKISNSDSSKLLLRTGGTPLKLAVVCSAKKTSSVACQKTVQRRASAVEVFRREISGGMVADIKTQQLVEMRRLGREQRQNIIREAGLVVEVPPEEGLAMRTELGIPWHSGLIPQEEIWIKIGGDKGGGSFKMVFEVANTSNPNSTRNTIIFTLFEAPDTQHNLQLGLNRHLDDIDNHIHCS